MKDLEQAAWRKARRRRRAVTALRWLATALSLAGTALVCGGTHADAGLWTWLAANALWVGLQAARRDWPQVALFGCYEALTVWGLCSG